MSVRSTTIASVFAGMLLVPGMASAEADLMLVDLKYLCEAPGLPSVKCEWYIRGVLEQIRPELEERYADDFSMKSCVARMYDQIPRFDFALAVWKVADTAWKDTSMTLNQEIFGLNKPAAKAIATAVNVHCVDETIRKALKDAGVRTR